MKPADLQAVADAAEACARLAREAASDTGGKHQDDAVVPLGEAVWRGAAARPCGAGVSCGGDVWTFTHARRQVEGSASGHAISVTTSVESAVGIEVARPPGYAAVIVVDQFPSSRAFYFHGSTARIIPCPAEPRDNTCIACPLSLDADGIPSRNAAIAFERHGPGARKASEAFVPLRRKRSS